MTVATPAVQPSGASALLAAYLAELAAHPLRTKALTSGTLSGLQEITATKLSGMPKSKNPDDFILGINKRVIQMTLYGLLVSGPLAHTLFELVTKRFIGKEGAKWKIAQILSTQVITSPIQNATYILAMALFAGARSTAQIKAAFKQGYLPMMKTSWMISPLSMAFAQKFLPPHVWVPFFNFVAFTFGTYVNTTIKKARLAQMKREQLRDAEKSRRDEL
ncbi:hypothetical protein BX616_004908 [Lobosporangium transversale]|uniref:Integral membrane protein n=1 Tax=Lobosporangium transversale TaxID=64571 RepID=A0A1Y2GK47_9FUNG|nr:hypothetical protein BCR41DRAFT_358404 [Lobosporangium transversale]KAF9915989.1 hypothetical protein BX616_004908 [Lobosporangium transversale]ORZ09744.1 hypothetical protein BCR41DRAFT_358404 [Lobosporangium transversale]|eukprot:XP_021879014.1 hypothetical protein BCR41DRAFT_358404 [Lobosporangium transversale]